MDAGLIPDEFRAVLDDPLLAVRPIVPGTPCMEQMGRCLALAYDLNEQPATSYSKRAVYSLLTTFVAMVTNIYAQQRDMPVGKRFPFAGDHAGFPGVAGPGIQTAEEPG